MKVAFTGSSGSGKTTLVTWAAKQFGLKHISGSAGDVLKDIDQQKLYEDWRYGGNAGHYGVIKYSAIQPGFGMDFQARLQYRRRELIVTNDNFITDRSPLDNLTYFINQCGFHPECNDQVIKQFALDCLDAWEKLTHVVYVKAVQPNGVENNGSRISNWWYQQSVDAQFEKWLAWFREQQGPKGPKVRVIDFWDLETRKFTLKTFLNNYD